METTTDRAAPTAHQLATLIVVELARPNAQPGGWRRWNWSVGPSVVGNVAAGIGAERTALAPLLCAALATLEAAGVVESDDGDVRLTVAGRRLIA